MKPPKRGDVWIDDDGTRWIVAAVTHENGQPRISRVREGSLAHEVMFGAGS